MTSETYSTFTTGFGGGGGSTTTATGSSSTAVVRRIRTPHPHDVLSGRGGGINAHPGNIVFREWVRVRKEDYNLAPNKAEKTRVAMEVMDQVREQDPPGRFLTRDTNASVMAGMGMGMGGGGGSWWVEVDENRALAKTSQALREGAPQIRSAHKDEIQQRKVQYAKEHPKPPKQHHHHRQQQHHGNSKTTTNPQHQRRPSQQSQSQSQSVRGGRRRRSSTTTTTATGSTSRLTNRHKRKVSEAFATTTTTTTDNNDARTAQRIVYGRGGGGGGSALTKRLAQGGGGGGGFTANTSNNNSSNILWNAINNNTVSNNANVPAANIAPAPSAAAAVTTGIGGRGLPRRVIPATNYRAIEKLQENARAAAAQQQLQQQEQQQHHHRHHHHHRYGGAVVDGGADTPPLVPHPSPSIGAPTHQGRMEQLSIGEPRDDDGVVLGFPKRNTNCTGSLKRVHSLALSEFSFGNITENEMGESPTIDEEFVNPFADESDISSRIAPAADRTSNSGPAADKASMLRNISSSNGDDYNLGGVPSTPSTATDDNADQQSHWYVDLVVDENDPTNLESDFTAGVKGIMDAVHPSDWTAPEKADDDFIPTLLMPWRGYNNGGMSGGISPVGRRSTGTSSSSKNNNRGFPVVELDELHQ